MKRNLELIKEILFAQEEERSTEEIHGFNKREIKYHIYLIGDSGLADTVDITSTNDNIEQHVMRLGLTSSGHDFVENARNESAWRKAKEKTGTASFTIFTSVLTEVVKNMIYGG